MTMYSRLLDNAEVEVTEDNKDSRWKSNYAEEKEDCSRKKQKQKLPLLKE